MLLSWLRCSFRSILLFFKRALTISGPQDVLAYVGVAAVFGGAFWLDKAEQRQKKIEEFHAFTPKYEFKFDDQIKQYPDDNGNEVTELKAILKNTGSVPLYANVYTSASIAFSKEKGVGISTSEVEYSTTGNVVNVNESLNIKSKFKEKEKDSITFSCTYVFYKINPVFNEYYRNFFPDVEGEKFSSFYTRIVSNKWNAPKEFNAWDKCNEIKRDSLVAGVENLISKEEYSEASKLIVGYNSTHPSVHAIDWGNYPILSDLRDQLIGSNEGHGS
ncbi:hypothetical protein [Thalassospira sp.]|uniref:hypothetical protein n=1 Tax=Thalassospira sp. TaxID=1912094 RepID=UPI0032F0800B